MSARMLVVLSVCWEFVRLFVRKLCKSRCVLFKILLMFSCFTIVNKLVIEFNHCVFYKLLLPSYL